jgi:hypothetical protein
MTDFLALSNIDTAESSQIPYFHTTQGRGSIMIPIHNSNSHVESEPWRTKQ